MVGPHPRRDSAEAPYTAPSSAGLGTDHAPNAYQRARWAEDVRELYRAMTAACYAIRIEIHALHDPRDGS